MTEEEVASREEVVEGASDEEEPVETTASETDAERIEALTAEKDKLYEQLLRTAADFDNYRKRSRKEVEQAERRGRENTLRDLLPVIDNLERAVEATTTTSEVNAVRDGVRMVLKQFEDVAGRIGLTRVVSVGERFDPNLHDAFQQIVTDEHPPGTIVQEYQPGYRLDERLLRPAMVVVARPPAPSSPPSESTEDEEPS